MEGSVQAAVLQRQWQQLRILNTEHVYGLGMDPVVLESSHTVMCDMLGIKSSSGH
jgi:hypothetical protein